mgnify:CR=1 FL=1
MKFVFVIFEIQKLANFFLSSVIDELNDKNEGVYWFNTNTLFHSVFFLLLLLLCVNSIINDRLDSFVLIYVDAIRRY